MRIGRIRKKRSNVNELASSQESFEAWRGRLWCRGTMTANRTNGLSHA